MKWVKYEGRFDPETVAAFIPKRGRKPDMRLAELDERAGYEVATGKYATDRQAAKVYLEEYAGRSYEADEWEAKNDKLKYITLRIRSARMKLSRNEN